jgi:hypothetical protein
MADGPLRSAGRCDAAAGIVLIHLSSIQRIGGRDCVASVIYTLAYRQNTTCRISIFMMNTKQCDEILLRLGGSRVGRT